ncbi:EAL domain-containing protein [Radiobacillus sp. PE A8.2]|uniref:EAL domain-containing protein n=1 Tax=Radiobacillus sp. PE A8.2 TaxID=3380349 RepID=UPI00388FA6D5
MLSTKRSATLFLIIVGLVYLGWVSIFKESESIKALGVLLLFTAAGLLSSLWLFKAYRILLHEHRYYWLLLGIGVCTYTIANIVRLLSWITEGTLQYTSIATGIWLISNLVFLVALIYKIKLINIRRSNNTHLFNLAINMIFAVAISIHFLIQPFIDLMVGSATDLIVAVVYPVISLCIIYVTASLYYLSKYSEAKKLIFFVVIGFTFLILGDWYYVYHLLTHGSHPGNLAELLWLYAILLIGLGGGHAQTKSVIPKWEIKNYIDGKEHIVSFISVIILLLFVINSYEWKFNALSAGLSVSTILMIVRQIYVMKYNKNIFKEYRYLAYHDPLTGLKNRTRFQLDLDKTMKQVESGSILLLDLDRFKHVNDSLGHDVGDQVLKEVSRRLRHTVKQSGKVYRMSGDEFIIIMPGVGTNGTLDLAKGILKAFQKPFVFKKHNIIMTPSIGISLYPEHGSSSGQLLKRADVAMYEAKQTGKNNAKLFSGEMDEVISRKMTIEHDLRHAIEKNQFKIYYQPKVEIETGKVVGTEALLRWQHPELGVIPPDEFIAIAEESGQINKIGDWVLFKACKQNKAWNDRYHSDLTISVNVSARQLESCEFVKWVKEIIKETNIHPKNIELELTESIMQNTEHSTKALEQLREIGVKTAIDDFGKGYSSLHILKALPIDTIKIDKIFIDDITDARTQSMIETIINLGRNLSLEVVAEGVEHDHQLKTLLAYNCKYGQGYLFSKPIKANELEKMLEEQITYKVN